MIKSIRFIILSFISIFMFQHSAFSADLVFTDELPYGYLPQDAEISDIPPTGVVLPVFAGDEQRYGTIAFGDSIDPNFHFAIDLFGINENMHTYRLYFDRNKNNDLTDDGGPWEAQALNSTKIPTFNVPYSTGMNRPYSFKLYVYFADWDLKYHVAYYSDCGWTGTVSISSTNALPILLRDHDTDGIYNTLGSDFMIVDLDEDNILEYGEFIRHFDAFLINDAAYALDTVAIDGTDVTFKPVPIGTLSGTIQSDTGTLLSKTKIEAFQSITQTTYTDSNGLYSLNLPLGQWRLRSSLYGYIPAYGNVTITENQAAVWNTDMAPIPYPNSGTITLYGGDSYDFATGERGQYSGGDFYYYASEPSFWANNYYQRGVIDLGDMGSTTLTEINPPESGYTWYGVDAVVGHTYVSLAHEGEEGCYIAFKVISMDSLSVTIDYNFIMKGDPVTLPTVYTNAVDSIMLTSAISGGNVTSDGGATVSQKGICWSTSPLPSILDSKSVSGSGTGVFSNLMTDLMPETTYHVRAYATNIAGTGYGAPVSFTTLAPTRVINLKGGLAFGEVQVGETRKLTFTISNSGNSTLNVSSITYPAGFTGNWTSGSIAASSAQTITVTFTPTTAATYGGTISVDSDKTSGINTLQTTGTGIQQTRIMALSASSLDFGNVNVNTTKQLSFTITNNGNTMLTVSSINYPSGFTGNWNAGTIFPGASQPITVSFKPTATQVYSGTITINANMTSGTNSIVVSGTGAIFYTISGYIRDTNDDGIDGVTLTFSNGKGTAMTDLTGYYSKIIDSGWTGLVTPSKNGISFTPSNRSYSNINSDRTNQDYAGGEPPTTFRVWIDKNQNQLYDMGEAIPGATVWINNETVERGITDDQGIIPIPNIDNAGQLYVQKMIYEMDNPKAVDLNFSNSRSNNPYYAESVNGKMYHFVMASDIMANDGTYHDFPGPGKTLLDVPKDPQGNTLIQLVHPKIEWNLVVAFEAQESASFYEQIETVFENYADYMYNFTDGYFVVKNVVLVKGAYIDTPQWNYCDVQIKNVEWPNAHIFGNRDNKPWHIHMGKVWKNEKIEYHPDQDDWYSTLGHESGHYLLGFRDEYLNGNGSKEIGTTWTYRAEHDGDPPDEPNEFPQNYGVMQSQYNGVHEISDPTDYFPRTYSPSMDPDLVTRQFMFREGLSCWSFFKSHYEDEIKQQMVANGLTDFADEFFNNLIDPPHQTGSYPESDRTKRPNPNAMNHDRVNFIEWTLPAGTRRSARSENVFDASALVLDATGKAVADAEVWLVSPDRISFQGKSGQDGAVKCGSLSPGKYLEAYHHGEKARLLIDAIQEKYILTLPPMKSTLSDLSGSSSAGMLIVAKPGISDSKHLMVTASGSGLNIAPAVILSQSHGYSVDIPMLNSGINKYTGSGDAQYDSGVLQVTSDTHQSVSPFVIYSTDMGPASGYYAPNGELEMVYSSNTFEGSGSFVILNSSALAPPNFGMVQIGNVYSFGFADTILSVRNVILNIKLPESGKGAHLNFYGWDIDNAMWIEIPGGNYNLDYFSISLASLMDYPAYGLFALPQANDPVPPEPVSGLLATTGDKLWNIDLQWTLPNDTDLLALDIRFNTEPVSMANWQQCHAISNKPEPATPGTIQSTSVEMPDPGTMYYFGIMTIDVSGNVSPLTTLNTPVRSNAADADGDGIPDLWETSNGLNPIVADATDDNDGDMIINLEEYQYRTAPYNSDTDRDGYSDGDEIAQGTDPNDFESFPDPLLYGGCEGDSWVPEVHFKYEDSNFREIMAWISGWSYSLTEIGKYNNANGIEGTFCLPECGYISSKFLLDFLNNKYYGQHVTSKEATKTIWEGVLKLYKCSD